MTKRLVNTHLFFKVFKQPTECGRNLLVLIKIVKTIFGRVRSSLLVGEAFASAVLPLNPDKQGIDPFRNFLTLIFDY